MSKGFRIAVYIAIIANATQLGVLIGGVKGIFICVGMCILVMIAEELWFNHKKRKREEEDEI